MDPGFDFSRAMSRRFNTLKHYDLLSAIKHNLPCLAPDALAQHPDTSPPNCCLQLEWRV